VSNNRYSLRVGAAPNARPTRRRRLGILAVEVSGTAAAVELAALVALRRPDGARALEAWTAPTFEVTSGEPIAAGSTAKPCSSSHLSVPHPPGALRCGFRSGRSATPAAIAGQSAATTLGNVWRVAQVTARPPAS
jgi:hypothetical protein